MDVQIKRVYEPADADDGARVLVDRLWPRGLSKAEATFDLWLKEAAPSPELRKSWHADEAGHEPERFEAFAEAYRGELAAGPGADAVTQLVAIAREAGRLTLLYGARDTQINHAVVLRDAVLEAIARN